MEANKKMTLQGQIIAVQAQLSAQKMEHLTQDMSNMTRDMNEIAKKTKMETISMRIVTLVTLLFLPGTFISVCDLVSCLPAEDGFANVSARLL